MAEKTQKKQADKKEKSKGELLKEDLFQTKSNLWDESDAKEKKKIFDFSLEYKRALDLGKTEREFIDYTVARLEDAGFKNLLELDRVHPGDRVYQSLRNKGLIAAVIGTEDPTRGFNLVGSHVDSPRLDLKPNPLYEANDLVLFKTHYYGGIKKYHWVGTQLAVHGVVLLKNGEKVTLNIGENPADPVFTVTDLLPHLGRDQMSQKANEVIKGEDLNVLIGGIPYPEKELQDRFKLGVLQLLHKQFGIRESDFNTAEIEIVPAHPARDVGFDRSFVGAYGQDDRICAYTSLAALLEIKKPRQTAGIVLFDKEETGSDGNTGAQSKSYQYLLNTLMQKILGREPAMLEIQSMYEHTHLLSSDVTNAFDPTYAAVSDPLNSAYAGKGISFNKYTGSGGKYSTNDAHSEFFAHLVRLLDQAKIPWQVAEMGKVDQGGGGTIAKYFSMLGMDVIDCGVPLFSMHSCFEIASKIDIYYTYLAYRAFMQNVE